MRRQLRTTLAALFAAALLSPTAQAQEAGEDFSLEGFLEDALENSQATLELCQLAVLQSETPAVQQLAEDEIQEHTRLNGALRRLAESEGLRLPEAGEIERRGLSRLEHTTGARFDEIFLLELMLVHQEGLLLFSRGARLSPGLDAQALATDALAQLGNHLQLARSLKEMIFFVP
jgi:putative membrane protein